LFTENRSISSQIPNPVFGLELTYTALKNIARVVDNVLMFPFGIAIYEFSVSKPAHPEYDIVSKFLRLGIAGGDFG
jgi:hypothetical protein